MKLHAATRYGFSLAWVLAIPLICVGCTSLSSVTPRSIDLNGTWKVDERASDPVPNIAEYRRQEDQDLVRGKSRDASASRAFVIQDFPIVAADVVAIEADDVSMGISYDGKYRDVKWGNQKRNSWSIRSGWNEQTLRIVSSRGKISGTESFSLLDSGKRLLVEISIKTSGKLTSFRRIFIRQ